MSFWKQLPPKPTLALRNFGPTRESQPTAWATSSIFAPVASQMADKALTEEMRCASMALAASLDSSEDHKPTVRIFSLLKDCQYLNLIQVKSTHGTQWEYTSLSDRQASFPSGVCNEPISTRSGANRSLIAVPSARNSGFERIWNRQPGFEFASRMVRIDSAVRQGTVDFSTTIFDEVAMAAIRRVASST